MNNPRVMLWLALAAILVLNYQAWVHDYGATDNAAATHTAASGRRTHTARQPRLGRAADIHDRHDAPPASAAPGAAAAIPNPPASEPAGNSAAAAPHVHVRTDVLDMDISLQGGTLQRADLLRYPKVKGGSEPVRLMNQDSDETLYLLKTGLVGPGERIRRNLQPIAHPRRLRARRCQATPRAAHLDGRARCHRYQDVHV
jgi:YidC/Oxa1 family membrane protein insertase